MQGKHLFEYAVIRIVPKVEREEFINVGVILYCKQLKFLQAMITLNEARLCAIAGEIDIAEVMAHLQAFERIAQGSPDAGPIACLDPAQRFRWLTATRSTILQASKVHPGFCTNPQETLEKLHALLVL